MTDPSALEWMTIHRLSREIEGGALSPVALVDTLLDRIARLDPQLHAFDFVDRGGASIAAERAASDIKVGRPGGPLRGIPIAVKDLCEVAGWPIHCGSAAWAGRRSTLTAAIVDRLTQAGAIVVGKTHMVEFAFGAWGTNHHLGTPLNPWDLGVPRVPGGSSSGSGVAVAAGLVPAAIGSDTGGSIRVPAAMCGIVGLKPTFGRVSRAGTIALSRTLDSIGPMTRSVEDAALIYAVLQGPDEADRATLGQPGEDPLAQLRAGVAGRRIGALPESELGQLHHAVAEAYSASVRVFRGLGAEIVTVPFLDIMDETGDAVGAMIATEGYAVVHATVDDQDAAMDPAVRRRFLAGRGMAAMDYLKLLEHREGVQRRGDRRIADVDVLLLPTCPAPPMPVAEIDEAGPPLSRFTRAANYLGWCGLALPNGWTPDGLPLSLQIVGPAFAEAAVLRTGWAFEQATDWHRRHPQF